MTEKIFTTSYNDQACELITSLVQVLAPTEVIEIGSQQGRSSVAIAKGLVIGANFATADLFEPNYSSPPYLSTHADQQKVLENLDAAGLVCNYQVLRTNGLALAEKIGAVDLLHVDICNHRDNLLPILRAWGPKVKKMILLEGGIYNNWQRKYGFEPYRDSLNEFNDWSHVTITINEHNAITIMTRHQQ